MKQNKNSFAFANQLILSNTDGTNTHVVEVCTAGMDEKETKKYLKDLKAAIIAESAATKIVLVPVGKEAGDS
jgi:hypothetical protein